MAGSMASVISHSASMSLLPYFLPFCFCFRSQAMAADWMEHVQLFSIVLNIWRQALYITRQGVAFCEVSALRCSICEALSNKPEQLFAF